MRLIVSLLAVTLCALFPSPSFASTQIAGTLESDTTWTKANGPYLVTNTFTIPATVTLTIEPGTIIKLPQNRLFLIYGTLITLPGVDPVVFTSERDDTAGGDTNTDGSSTTPAPGDWYMVYFVEGSVGALAHTIFRYGGSSSGAGYSYASVVNQGGTLECVACQVEDSETNLLLVQGGTTTLTHSRFRGGIEGIHMREGVLMSSFNTFEETTRPLVLEHGTFTLFQNDFGNSPYPNLIHAEVVFVNMGGNTRNMGFQIDGILTGNQTWIADDLPYLLTNTFTIPVDATLTIKPGCIVKLYGNFFWYIFGTLDVGGEGTTTTITSLRDDTVGGYTVWDSAIAPPVAGDWLSLYFVEGSRGTFTNTNLRYGGRANGSFPMGQIWNEAGTVTVIDSHLTNTAHHHIFITGNGTTTISATTFENAPNSAIWVTLGASTVSVHQSIFQQSTGYAINNTMNLSPIGAHFVDASDNFWGDSTGPYHLVSNPNGKGAWISDYVHFTPFLTKEPIGQCMIDCNSNVLFLPGIMGSRLYRMGTSFEDQLWEPNTNSDVEELFLNEAGGSLWNGIYTRDVLDEANVSPVLQKNIYLSFLKDLKQWKEEDHLIADYSAVPYDWRLSLEDILQYGNAQNGNIYYSGTNRATSTPYLIQELRRLAESSRTGKVTIIAHSNGGLLAKALTNVLGPEASTLIDQMIFVAVPQVGTPQGVGALLHGFDQGIPNDTFPVILTPDTARTFASTSPMTYNLQPSNGYFTQVDDPVVTFDNSLFLLPWRLRYGASLHSEARLHDFITDSARIPLAVSDPTVLPQIGSDPLLTRAEHLHTILDAWVPPLGVTLTEIAGWGEPTLKTISYEKGYQADCTGVSFWKQCPIVPVLQFTPMETIDGDGTVVVPSALWTKGEGVGRYWVDLKKYNNKLPLSIFHLDNQHAAILEVPELRKFVASIITNQFLGDLSSYEFISVSSPQASTTDSRLHFLLHSPLALHLYDDQGNHTGISTTTGRLEVQIPGSRYKEYGEVKLLEAPASTTLHLLLQGYASGSFTLDVEERQGTSVLASTTFSAVPSSPGTIATMTFPVGGSIVDATPLTVDEDGDGSPDMTLTPMLGELVFPDYLPPETTATASGSTSPNGWYTSPVSVILEASDSGSGVKAIWYSTDGVVWNHSASSTEILINTEGTTTLRYYAVDRAGNAEQVTERTVVIYRPVGTIRAILTLHPQTHVLSVEGVSDAGQVTVTKHTDGYTLRNAKGQTTRLFFRSQFSDGRIVAITLARVQYGTDPVLHLRETTLSVESPKSNSKDAVVQKLEIAEQGAVEARYDPKKRVTRVKVEGRGAEEQVWALVGLRVLQVTVDNGVVGYGW